MPNKIVKGQRINSVKKKLARNMRKEMTPAESKLWSKIRRKAINGCKFRRQQIIRGFIVDFYCHEKALIIEVDGDIHSLQRLKDEERQTYLEKMGFRVLRFTNNDVLQNMDAVLKSLESETRGSHVC